MVIGVRTSRDLLVSVPLTAPLCASLARYGLSKPEIPSIDCKTIGGLSRQGRVIETKVKKYGLGLTFCDCPLLNLFS